MRATENFARLLICSNASRGIVPISAWTSQTAISTSSHFWNLVSSDQSAPISGRVYLSRSEEHTSELQSRQYLVCRLLLEKKKQFRQLSLTLNCASYSTTEASTHTTTLPSMT